MIFDKNKKTHLKSFNKNVDNFSKIVTLQPFVHRKIEETVPRKMQNILNYGENILLALFIYKVNSKSYSPNWWCGDAAFWGGAVIFSSTVFFLSTRDQICNNFRSSSSVEVAPKWWPSWHVPGYGPRTKTTVPSDMLWPSEWSRGSCFPWSSSKRFTIA